MLFDEENGYTPEFIYGNYFERLLVKSRGVEKEKEKEKEEKVGNLGLRELIDGVDSGGARILHRNVNAGSPRKYKAERTVDDLLVQNHGARGLISFFIIC